MSQTPTPLLAAYILSPVEQELLAGKAIVFDPNLPEDQRSIPARVLREAAIKGVAIEIDHAVIPDAADLSGVRFTTHCRIKHTKFLERATFDYAEFDRPLSLTGSQFAAGVSFDSARFRSDVWLDEVRVGRRRDGDRVVFNDAELSGVLIATALQVENDVDVSFERAHFQAAAYIRDARFGGRVIFDMVRADASLDLVGSHFRRELQASFMRVGSYIDLSRTRFTRAAPATMTETHVDGAVYCHSARFGAGVQLFATHIKSSFDARSACFLRAAQLREGVVSGRVDLTDARFGRRAQLLLAGALVGRHVSLNGARLKAGATLTGLTAEGDIEAQNVKITGMLRADRMRVRGSLQFQEGHFQYITLHSSKIDAAADLSNAVIDGELNAAQADFGAFTFTGRVEQHASLLGAKIEKSLLLTGACFRGAPEALDIGSVHVGGHASLDRARFDGNLNAIGLVVEHQCSLHRVLCRGSVNFYELTVRRGFFARDARFRGSFEMSGARIDGELYVNAAKFRRDVAIVNSDIRSVRADPDPNYRDRPARFFGRLTMSRSRIGYLNFKHVRCECDEVDGVAFAQVEVANVATFNDARFAGPVSFYSATFGGEVLLQRVTFAMSLDARGALFRSNVYFAPVVFHADVDFTSARFEQLALFRARFTGNAAFDSCRFRALADFSNARLPGEFEPLPDEWVMEKDQPFASGCRFESRTSFAHAVFDGDAQFANCSFHAQLDLHDASLASLFLPHAGGDTWGLALPSSVDLRGCSYDELAVDTDHLLWSTQPSRRFWVMPEPRQQPLDRQPYVELEKKLRATGDVTRANRVHLSWRNAERQTLWRNRRGLRWTSSAAYRILANYGVRPYRLAVASLLLIVLGTWYFAQPGTMAPKDNAQRARTPSIENPTNMQAIGMSLRQFLPVSIALGEELVPTHDRIVSNFAIGERRVAFTTIPAAVGSLLTLLGWILVPLGVGSVAGLLRRLP